MNQVVAWITNGSLYGLRRTEKKTAVVHRERTKVAHIPVFIEPPASKPWVSLTDEEIEAVMPSGIYDCLADPWDCGVGDGNEMRSIKKDVLRIARAIETKLREKNA